MAAGGVLGGVAGDVGGPPVHRVVAARLITAVGNQQCPRRFPERDAVAEGVGGHDPAGRLARLGRPRRPGPCPQLAVPCVADGAEPVPAVVPAAPVHAGPVPGAGRRVRDERRPFPGCQRGLRLPRTGRPRESWQELGERRVHLGPPPQSASGPWHCPPSWRLPSRVTALAAIPAESPGAADAHRAQDIAVSLGCWRRAWGGRWRLGPVADPAQQAEGALAEGLAAEQRGAGDRERDRQLDHEPDRAKERVGQADADRGAKRGEADARRAPGHADAGGGLLPSGRA